MERKKELLIRAYLVTAFFVVLTMVIIYRVFNISIVEGEKWKAKGADHLQWRTVEADRGNIFADDMSLLVTTLPFFEIRMDTKVARQDFFNENIDSLAYGLAELDKSFSQYEWKTKIVKARKQGNGYLLIARNLNAEEIGAYKTLPIFRRGQYGGGLIVIRNSRREKPFGQFASRTIGTDRENASKVGLEDYFDKWLKGPEEQRLMKKVSSTEWVPFEDLLNHDVKKGNDLYTTLDIAMQDVTHHALLAELEKVNAKAGTAIVMEVSTGAIKAIANLGKLESGYYAETYNFAVGRSSEPGSTFKLASVLAMLDDGYADLDTKVDLGGGKKKFYDQWMYDSKMHGITKSDLREAFEISSNVGIASLTNKFYKDKLRRKQYKDKLCQFGLCDKTGIEIRGEEMPYIKDPVKDIKDWSGTTIPWMSHGYELHLSPLQMLAFYNAVANDGKMMKPYLVKEIRHKSKLMKAFDPKIMNEQIASPITIRKAQELLKGVVQRGTAKNLRSDIVSMAGKTGTTVVGYADKDKPRRYNASFAGYFPADDPMYTVMIVVYEPKGTFYGSSVAAPVFKEIAEKYSAINVETQHAIAEAGIASTDRKLPGRHAGHKSDFKQIFDYVQVAYKDKGNSTWVEVDPFETKMLIDRKKIRKTTIPDVTGMGARDAIYVLENLGIEVDIEGVGKVTKQSLKPGIKNKKQAIKIYLN